MNCEFESKNPPQKAQRLDDQYVLISSSNNDPGDFKDFPKEGQTTQVNAAIPLNIEPTGKFLH